MGLPYSNPAAAGIDAFTKIVGMGDQLENSKMRRELISQEVADRKQKRAWEAKVQGRQEKLWGREDDILFGQNVLNNLASVFDADAKAKASGTNLDLSTLSDDQQASILHMAGHKGLFGPDGKVNVQKVQDIKTLQTALRSRETVDAMNKKGRIVINDKKVMDAINSVWGSDLIDAGTDKAGNRARKTASAALIDFSSGVPTVTFDLNVEPPKSGAGNLIPVPGYEKNVYSVPEDPNPKGMIERGNIDLSQRKVCIFGNGSVGTVRTMGIEFDGKEVNIPTISPDGKPWTKEEAISAWKKTISKEKPYGDHLGVFDNEMDAANSAEKIHSSKLWQSSLDYYTKGNYTAPMTWGRDASPDAPVKQIPAPFLASQLDSLDKISGYINQLEAKYGSTKFSERVRTMQATRDENKAISEAYASIDTNQSANDQRNKFVQEITKRNPNMPVKDAVALAKTIIEEKKEREIKLEEVGVGGNNVIKMDPKTGITYGKPYPKHKEDAGEKKKDLSPKEGIEDLRDTYIQRNAGDMVDETGKAPDWNTFLAKKGQVPVGGKKDEKGKPVTMEVHSRTVEKYYQDARAAGESHAEAKAAALRFGEQFGERGSKTTDLSKLTPDALSQVTGLDKSASSVILGNISKYQKSGKSVDDVQVNKKNGAVTYVFSDGTKEVQEVKEEKKPAAKGLTADVKIDRTLGKTAFGKKSPIDIFRSPEEAEKANKESAEYFKKEQEDHKKKWIEKYKKQGLTQEQAEKKYKEQYG
jgi:hypothetical protein